MHLLNYIADSVCPQSLDMIDGINGVEVKCNRGARMSFPRNCIAANCVGLITRVNGFLRSFLNVSGNAFTKSE